jgi:Putative DNA-binding domain
MLEEKVFFDSNQYPLRSVAERLAEISTLFPSGPFKLLVWTEDRKGFIEYKNSRGEVFCEEEFGYSTKEEKFFTELIEKGNRWSCEIATRNSDLQRYLTNEQFQVLVIVGEDLLGLARRAIHYLEKLPNGPKRVVLGFHNRPLISSDLYPTCRFLKDRGRLHLLHELALLNSNKARQKYLPSVPERSDSNAASSIWAVAIDQITEQHILRLFKSEKEEDDHLDYKDQRCLKGKGAEDLLYDFCAMANAEGGVIIIGVREENGHPMKPLTRGLQSVASPDKELNRIDQMRNSKFGLTGPEIDSRSIKVLGKRLLLIKVHPSVTEPVGVMTRQGKLEYPIRQGRIKTWQPYTQRVA